MDGGVVLEAPGWVCPGIWKGEALEGGQEGAVMGSSPKATVWVRETLQEGK